MHIICGLPKVKATWEARGLEHRGRILLNWIEALRAFLDPSFKFGVEKDDDMNRFFALAAVCAVALVSMGNIAEARCCKQQRDRCCHQRQNNCCCQQQTCCQAAPTCCQQQTCCQKPTCCQAAAPTCCAAPAPTCCAAPAPTCCQPAATCCGAQAKCCKERCHRQRRCC